VTCAVENLFFAGDWVKNDIDLACMEGAVSAALDCGKAIAERYASRLPDPGRAKGSVQPKRFGETKAWLLARAAAPAVFGLWLAAKVEDALRSD
jgi:hypothetical protein